jgi:hypothetical protein
MRCGFKQTSVLLSMPIASLGVAKKSGSHKCSRSAEEGILVHEALRHEVEW